MTKESGPLRRPKRERGNEMIDKCVLSTEKAQPVLSVRTRSAVRDLPMVLGREFGKVALYLNDLGELPSAPPFVGYFNMDMDDLDIEVGFPVAKKLPGKDDIKAGEIPAGEYVTLMYTGSYENIEEAYNALTEWTEENCREMTGVAYEFYYNDPGDTPADELQTKIMLPLKEL